MTDSESHGDETETIEAVEVPATPRVSFGGTAIVNEEPYAGSYAMHFGSPNGEQRALDAGKAFAVAGWMRAYRVSGADRLVLLNAITSQEFLTIEAGETREGLVLDANGRIEHSFWIAQMPDAESSILLVEATHALSLVGWLTRMRFRYDVQFALIEAPILLTFEGPVAERARQLKLDEVDDVWDVGTEFGTQYATLDEHPAENYRARYFVLHPETWARELETLRKHFSEAGSLAAEALRVAAWRPASAELDAKAIAHEFDWLRSAVHLTKGCYRGQETIAKVHNIGRPPRRLVFVHLDYSEAEQVEPGDLLTRADDETAKPVGRVTSVAFHYEDGAIALALVGRTLDPAAEIIAGANERRGPVAASLSEIVPPDAGHTASIPKLARLGRRRS